MALQLIMRLITGESGIFIARMRRLVVFYLAMAVFAAAAAGFLIAALFIALAERYGGVEAALGFAVVFLLLLMGCYVLSVDARRPPRRRADDRLQRDIASIAGVTVLSNAPLLFASVRKRRSLLLFPVVVAGAYGVWRALSGFRRRS